MATVDRQINSCQKLNSKNKPAADRLGIANAAGLIVLAFAITALILLFLASSFRPTANHDESLQLVSALGLNSLSLMPSGRPLRNPGAFEQPVDLRFDPKIGQIHFDGAEFVLRVSD